MPDNGRDLRRVHGRDDADLVAFGPQPGGHAGEGAEPTEREGRPDDGVAVRRGVDRLQPRVREILMDGLDGVALFEALRDDLSKPCCA